MSEFHSSSLMENVAKRRWDPIWSIRLFAGLALGASLQALTVCKTGNQLVFCLGLTLGILLGLFVQSFAIKATESSRVDLKSDVDDLRVTP